MIAMEIEMNYIVKKQMKKLASEFKEEFNKQSCILRHKEPLQSSV